MIVDNDIPTSTLLEIKVGQFIENEAISGNVTQIEIQETDEFLMFLFSLEQGKQIVIRKLKQVC